MVTRGPTGELAGQIRRVRDAIASGGPADDAAFDALALPLYRALLEEIPAWGRLARARGLPPEAASSWRDVAPIPTDAFRRLDLHAPSAGEVVRTFETSGTTSSQPGRALFDASALALMDLAIDAGARVHLFPDGPVGRVHVLGPSPEAAPGKVMLQGMMRLGESFAGGRVVFHVGPRGLDLPALLGALEADARDGIPVLIAGASGTFVQLADGMGARGPSRLPLAPRSRLLDAGGYKGQGREPSRAEFRALMGERFQLPPERCVNLLGMTELSSQFYEDSLAAAHEGVQRREGFVNPPWTRTRVLNPDTLAEVPGGVPGLLAHLDLASATRPFAVLTTDLGVREGDRFRVTGRARGAEARGCSIGAEAWTDAAVRR